MSPKTVGLCICIKCSVARQSHLTDGLNSNPLDHFEAGPHGILQGSILYRPQAAKSSQTIDQYVHAGVSWWRSKLSPRCHCWFLVRRAARAPVIHCTPHAPESPAQRPGSALNKLKTDLVDVYISPPVMSSSCGTRSATRHRHRVSVASRAFFPECTNIFNILPR
jgi:hypothetical protein